MDFAKVFGKAWKFAWKHKILWLFGLFAGTAAAGSQGGNASGIGYRFPSNSQNMNLPHFFNQFGQQVQNWFTNLPGWVWSIGILAFILIILLMVIASLFLETLGLGGLVSGAVLADEKTDGKALSFGEVFRKLKPFYWRLFLLRLVVMVGSFLFGLIIVAMLVFIGIFTLGIGLLCLVPLLILVIPLGWFLTGFIANCSIALVDEDLQIFPAIARAWRVSWDHFWTMVGVGALLGLINFVAFILIGVPFILAFLPVIIPAIAQNTAIVMQTGWTISIILAVVWLVISLFLFGWLNSFTFTTRTLTYRELKNRHLPVPTTYTAMPDQPMEPPTDKPEVEEFRSEG